ncbi:transcriptional regulator [Micromonospora zingiberis]|uniref:Transcriptional regulator n=1 Tax=Micromonospora zingiberis TaxID=2053011 RepID=A0A4R0GJD2_9ACTN|nr:BTAD domain-containing putative transcriptional regulator [Micromonospora zingiberis]TCB95498.1 transcriptional regulator [Micromonospora zingiberis]
MMFRVLGPLEVLIDGRPIRLGGIKQRATLAFLLLKANQVVPTSQLLAALWPDKDPPTSARKVLQNAVWSLRTALSVTEGSDSLRLSTQAPGYILQVNPADVDLFRFYQLAERGRAEKTQPERAAATLREALATWRGTALSDLVENGISWPELTVVENARLDTQQDWFDAELACGRHQSVLGELEAMVEAQPLRERACGQLMLALYRCGRHADALAVYSGLRTSLVENLGLEPGPALQKLQHAILTHDPSLTLDPASVPAPARDVAVVRNPLPVPPIPAPRAPSDPRRAHLTLAMVRVRSCADAADPVRVDYELAAATRMVRSGIEELGGTVATSIGSATLAVFDGPPAHGGDEERAVRAALTLRDCFTDGMGRDLVMQVAVATGETLVLTEPNARLTLGGTLVDRCHQMLSAVPEGTVWACPRTRELTGDAFDAAPAADGAWEILGVRGHTPEHDSDLALVRGLLDRTLRRNTPHLVTVLGESDDLLDRLAGMVDGPRVLDGRIVPHDPLRAVAELVTELCGLAPDDAPEVMRERLRTSLGAGRPATSERLVSALLPLLRPGDPARPDTLAAWKLLLEQAARARPLVVLLRDLHLAGDDLLDAVEDLADLDAPLPLLVVVTAGPALLSRRPSWGGGKPHAASITLDPPGNGTVNRLRHLMASACGGGQFGGELPDPCLTPTPQTSPWNLGRPERRLVELEVHPLLPEARPSTPDPAHALCRAVAQDVGDGELALASVVRLDGPCPRLR